MPARFHLQDANLPMARKDAFSSAPGRMKDADDALN